MKKLILSLCISAAFFTVLLIYATNHDKLTYTGTVSELSEGDTGHEVSVLQQQLENMNYLTIGTYKKGVYDTFTSDAVRNFQIDNALEGTGIASVKLLMNLGMGKLYKPGDSYAAATASAEKLLAMAINGEARGEPYEGQVAVGAIILNRVRSSSFPNTIAGVVYQPYAFSSVNDGQIYYSIGEGTTVLKAARDALNGWDPTYGCLYFWNPETATSKWIWSRKVVRVIGKHYFGI